MPSKSIFLLVTMLLAVANTAYPFQQTKPISAKELGKRCPNPSNVKDVDIDLALKVISMKVKVDNNAVKLFNQKDLGLVMESYVRCVAIHRDGYTIEQAQHVTNFFNFMKTTPTPEQVMKWQACHPFPSKNAPPSNCEPPKAAKLEYKIHWADDKVFIRINDKPAGAGGPSDWTEIPSDLLSIGGNALKIEVFNQRSKGGGLFGKKEGWRYEVEFRSAGKNWKYGNGEDDPPDERWGNTFTVENRQIIVKADGSIEGIR